MISALSEMNVPPEQMPYTEPLVADLLIAYAFDLPGLFQILTKADLQRLDLTPGELRRIALTNLRGQVSLLRVRCGKNKGRL